MKLHKIIYQLSPNDFSILSEQLKETKADKFSLLLNHYRKVKTSDEDLLKILDLKLPAFYTLKSRLFDKIQEFLYKNTTDTRIELLQNVANVEHLVYKTPRETAIGILKKLEEELIEHDMPNELITIYKALKQLHLHSDKYYDYLQLYNKHVAYYLAQDKAEEILSQFCKTLGDYYLNRNTDTLDLLVLYRKEMLNICKLYSSHHLQMYKNILLTHFALFCPLESEMKEDFTIEEMLTESMSIINSHEHDRKYKHFKQIINFLYFEYYQQLNLQKNSIKYFEKITENSDCLLLLNHCSFVYHFLISKIEYYKNEKKENQLINEEETFLHVPDINDITSYIIFHFSMAIAYFYGENYLAAIQTLNKLINEISFKNYSFAELEIKTLLATLNILSKRFDQADIIIRSISRKIADENDEIKYHSASTFLKLLKTSISIKNNEKLKKMIEINNAFESANNGKYAFLKSLKLNEKHLQLLAK